jgi:hypothetical protein
MADYTTNLKAWGSTGQVFPDNYSYIENEAPVDAWDNFVTHNLITDVRSHLIPLTNSRIETDYGLSGGEPSSPEPSHLYHDTDNESLSFWDLTNSSWHRVLTADGDTLTGALNFDGNSAQNVGSLSMSGTADLDSNNLEDAGTVIWDTINGHVSQAVLEGPSSSLSSYPLPKGDLAEDYALTSRFPLVNSDLQNTSVTVTTGNQLTGGGSISLGGSATIGVDDGTGSGLDADLLDGEHASAFADSGHIHDSRYYTETESDSRFALDGHDHDTWYLQKSGGTMSGTLTLSDGSISASRSWVSSNHLSQSGGTLTGNLTLTDGSTAASRNWVNANADVPNANYADNAGDADTVDGKHESAFADSGHLHDSRYLLESGDSMSGVLNLSNNDLKDGTTTIWDASVGHINQTALENSSFTVAGNTISLGGSTSVSHSDLTDSPASAHHTRYADSEAVSAVNSEVSLTVDISGDSDTLDGEHASAFADSGHLHDSRYITESGDTMNGILTLNDGSTAASRNWVNSNADVPNADYADDADTLDGEHASAFADSGHLHDNRYLLEGGDTLAGILDLGSNDLEDGTTTIWDATNGYVNQSVLQNTSVTVAGNSVTLGNSTSVALGDLSNVTATGEGSGNGFDADTVDGEHAGAFADAGHLHDSRYARLFAGVQNPVYETKSDVPNMTKGEAVFVDGDGLYIEDGT